MNTEWTIQRASDLARDGLGLELSDSAGTVRAEVFRCDADHSLTVQLFDVVPFTALEWLISVARDQLGPFEDGTPLPPALMG